MYKRFISENRWVSWLMLGLALLGLSSSALADASLKGPGGADVWTVYAFGNAEAVSDTFRAVYNYCSSGTFRSLVGLIAMIGVLSVGISGGFSGAMAKNFISYTVTVFLVTYLFFGVGGNGPVVVQVDVQDFSYTPAGGGGGGGTLTVGGLLTGPVTVPAVVGIPASIISTAGHEITRQIEGSFGALLPGPMQLSMGAPFNLAASLISDSTSAKITDPNLSTSMAYYIQDCFVTGVARGDLLATSLVTSNNFLKDIQTTYDTVMVTTMLKTDDIGSSNVVTCSDAWSYIKTAVDGVGTGAGSYLQNASAWARTPALSVVNAAADSVAQWATNSGISDGAAMVKQAAVLATFSGAFKQTATQTGNSDFITGLAVNQAYESQITGWIVGAELFNRIMGYIFAIVQVFVYAVTPLILAAALIPSLGLSLLKNYTQILVWLASWQPMLAIVNFIVLSMQKPDIQAMLSTGPGAADYGITLSNMAIVSQKSANMRAAATFIGTMVPVFSWAMVKGAMDFSGMISSAVGEKFASGAANTMTTGNYSLNQGSMDSFTANKHSTASTGDWGFGRVSSGGVLNSSQDVGGANAKGNGGETARATATKTTTVTEQFSNGGTTQDMRTGSGGTSFSTGANFGSQGSLDTSSGNSQQSFISRNIQGVVGGNATLPVLGGTSAGGKATPATVAAAGGAAGGTAGGAGGTTEKPAGNMDKPPEPKNARGSPVKAALSASGSGALGLGQMSSDNYQKGSRNSKSGATNTAGSRVKNSLHAASDTKMASVTKSTTLTDQLSLTPITSVSSAVDTAREYRGNGGLLFGGSSGGGAFIAGSAQSALPSKMGEVLSGDAIEHKSSDTANATNKEMASHKKTEKSLAGDADKSAKDAIGKGEKLASQYGGQAEGGRAAAEVRPFSRASGAVLDMMGIDHEKRESLEALDKAALPEKAAEAKEAAATAKEKAATTMNDLKNKVSGSHEPKGNTPAGGDKQPATGTKPTATGTKPQAVTAPSEKTSMLSSPQLSTTMDDLKNKTPGARNPKVSAPANSTSATPAGAQPKAVTSPSEKTPAQGAVPASNQPAGDQHKAGKAAPANKTSAGQPHSAPAGKDVAQQPANKEGEGDTRRQQSIAPQPQAPQLVQQPQQQAPQAQQPQQPGIQPQTPTPTEPIKVADTGSTGQSTSGGASAEISALESKVASAEQRSANLATHMQQAEQILSSASSQNAEDLLPLIDKARSQVKQT